MSELKEHMSEELDVELSPKLWHAFFNAIDQDMTGTINVEELVYFLFVEDL